MPAGSPPAVPARQPRRRGGGGSVSAERYRRWCEGWYGGLRRVLAPSLRYSQFYYEEALAAALGERRRWLDLGCGHQVLPPWRQEREQALVGSAALAVGADRDWRAMRAHRTLALRVGCNIGALPFADASFDLVSANMVIEHLDAPGRQFAEIARVLAPGGCFLFHTPNLYGYYTLISCLLPESWKHRLALLLQGRPSEDVYPTYYRANTARRVQQLAAEAGFEAPQLRHIPSTPQTIPLPPLVPVELLWIRVTMLRAFAPLRTNLIAVLRKPEAAVQVAGAAL